MKDFLSMAILGAGLLLSMHIAIRVGLLVCALLGINCQ